MIALFSFLFGLAVGSFLNMAVFRLSRDDAFFAARSFCDYCKNFLKFLDLLPVVSFLASRGKTRCCGKPLPRQYPIVEFLCGACFLLAFFAFEESWIFIVRAWILVIFLFFIFLFDAKYYLVHTGIVSSGIIIVFLINFFAGFSLKDIIFSSIVGAGFYGIQYFISRGKWVGEGDMWLGAFLGGAFGFRDLLIILFLAYILGAFSGIFLIMLKKKSLSSRLPMGVFLTSAALITLFLGDTISQYYFSLLI